ncbi:MAG: hypothetical protein Q8Q42_04620 [Nanoarchaeota archaeon]|nr:hypothetical protein [Nanoarchaeota archaeon]
MFKLYTNRTCVSLPGTGPTLCSPLGSACDNSAERHSVCMNNQCLAMPGPGPNQCNPVGSNC